MRKLHINVEPGVQPLLEDGRNWLGGQNVDKMNGAMLASIAISLKRIADMAARGYFK